MPNDQELSEYHARAMMEHLGPRSVALILPNSNDRPDEVGSGTCVQISDRYLVATVAHNFDDVDLRQIWVTPLGTRPGMASRDTPHCLRWGRRGGRSELLDIGWLEIEPAAISTWCSMWERAFVTLERFSIAPIPIRSDAFLLGQPAKYVKYEPHGPVNGEPFVGLMAFPFLTRTVERPDSEPADSQNVYLEYPESMFTAEGVRPTPDPEGLSGSGMWLVNPKTNGLWTPDAAKLVAVQECAPKRRWLRGTPIRAWLQMVREDIPDLAFEIDRAFPEL
jgi:hypothetical protein